jgi:hypothetical protein
MATGRLTTPLACALVGCSVATGALELSDAQLEEEVASAIVEYEVAVVVGTLPGGGPLVCDPLVSGELTLDDDRLRVSYRDTFRVDPENGGVEGAAPRPIGHLDDGRALFLAVARDDACRVVARACLPVLFQSGQDREVVLDLEAVTPPARGCVSPLGCVGGTCGPCVEDAHCDDGDLCTADRCVAGECRSAPAVPDLDEDGHGSQSCAGGDDCDDGDPLSYPGATRRCGRGVDHDCDGMVDDAQGCGPCSPATGLATLGSIAVPVEGLFVLGPAADGPATYELLVSTTSGAIEVHAVDSSGTHELLGSTDVFDAPPFAPQVIGDYTLVAGPGASGVALYLTDDLRSGGATPVALADIGGEELGTFLAGAREAYASTVSEDPSLVRLDLAALPTLPAAERLSTPGAWAPVSALVTDGAWLFGVLGPVVSWARLSADGATEETGATDLSAHLGAAAAGYGLDVALSPDRVVLAQGYAGLMLVTRASFDPEVGCCEYDRLVVPEGCSGALCFAARHVALAGPDRAVVLSGDGSGSRRTLVSLVDIGDPAAPREVDSVYAAGTSSRDVVVSGSMIFAASVEPETGAGSVDLVEIVCE